MRSHFMCVKTGSSISSGFEERYHEFVNDTSVFSRDQARPFSFAPPIESTFQSIPLSTEHVETQTTCLLLAPVSIPKGPST